MPSNPLLSICIPTYNRDKYLKQCLDSIVLQFSDPHVRNQVEISVSDNCSTDTTEKLVAEFRAQYTNIIYQKNSENIGFDRNLLNSISAARGAYCWMLGDDDALFDYALSEMLQKLQAQHFAYILVNCQGYDHDLQAPVLSRPNMNLVKDLKFGSLRDFVLTIADYNDRVGYFGGMSCQIVKREIWESFLGKSEFLDTQIIHLKGILAGFKDLPALVVAKPMVKVRAENMRWDLVPGQETIIKRAKATKETALWIMQIYHIPYSRWGIEWGYYWGIIKGSIITFSKRTVFRHPIVRKKVARLVKFILRK